LIGRPGPASHPQVNLTATAGQTYYVSVGDYSNGSSGSVLLSIFGQPGTPTGPSLTIAKAVELQFATVTNTTYRIQESSDLQTWNTLTNVVTGNDLIQQIFLVPQGPTEMYRVTAQ
jgi:hypothetical protein